MMNYLVTYPNLTIKGIYAASAYSSDVIPKEEILAFLTSVKC